jgi:hypothetical protein
MLFDNLKNFERNNFIMKSILKKRFAKTILLLILFLPIVAKFQQIIQPDSLLNKLIGKRVLKVTIAGKETIHDVDAKGVLNGQYVQLTEVSRTKDGKGNPLYEAIIYICWLDTKKQYFCLWLDNTSDEGISNQVIGRAQQNGNKIELIFKFSNGTKFYTTFLYDRKIDSWQ